MICLLKVKLKFDIIVMKIHFGGGIFMLENKLLSMELGGYVGERLNRHEKSWIQEIFNRNPNLFGAFKDREVNTLHKAQWHGEFPGKLLTGIAQTYRMTHNADTFAMGERIVDELAAVQDDDGYLGPWSRAARLDGDKDKWDTWGIYHCVYGLYLWYKVTGNKKALDVAMRALDQIYDYFLVQGHRLVGQNWVEMNFAVSHTFALLYKETLKPEYLEAAEYIVLKEWKMEYDDYFSQSVITCNWMDDAIAGVPFYKSNQKRWEAQHTIQTLGILYDITKREDYLVAYKNLWQSIVDYDRHNFGGFGSGEGASGTPYVGGCETCNTVAWAGWTNEYFALTKSPDALEELELSYFNAAWGSLVDDVIFNYYNVMEGERITAPDILAGHGFDGGTDMSCCQANGTRGVSQISEWAILHENNCVYLNYYGEYKAQTVTPSGKALQITQKTEYPFDGRIKIEINPEACEQFSIVLRVPSWSENTEYCVNGDKAIKAEAGSFIVLDREWLAGDSVELSLDMSLHYLVGAEQTLGKVSIYRGPVLMAVSSEREPAEEIVITDCEKAQNTYPEFNKSDVEGGTIYRDGGAMVKIDALDTDGNKQTFVSYADVWQKGLEYQTWFVLK